MSFIPNSFQLPNSLIDNGYMALMKGAALPCYIFIVRKTRGWNKTQDCISTSQLIEGTGYKKDAVLGGVNQLIEMGIVRKISYKNKPSKYTLTDDVVAVEKTASDISAIGKTDTAVGNTDSNLSEIPTHNNNIKTTNTKTINIYSDEPKKPRSKTTAKFDFKTALMEQGVSEELATEFMFVRKSKRSTDTKRAFDRLMTEIGKTHFTAQQAIEYCLDRQKPWGAFEASWYDNETKPQSFVKPQPEQPKRLFGNPMQVDRQMKDVGSSS